MSAPLSSSNVPLHGPGARSRCTSAIRPGRAGWHRWHTMAGGAVLPRRVPRAVAALVVLVLATATRALGQEDGLRIADLLPPSEDLRWEDVPSWRDMPSSAVWCGYQYPNDETSRRERSYIARVYRIGSLIPGKVSYWGASAAVANSTFNSISSCEVAIVNPRRVLWVAASNGNIPAGAPVTGLSRDGTPLFSCKFHFDRHLSMACGAVQRYTERCVAEMDGSLVSSPVYEVLTLLPSYPPFGAAPPPPPPLPFPYSGVEPRAERYSASMQDDQMPRPAGRQK